MGLFHRKLLSSTVTFIFAKPPPCAPQSSPCFIFCPCVKPLPPPPPAPPHEHRLLTTGMTVAACVLGVFFVLGIACMVARFRYLKRIESRRRSPPVLFLARDDFADEPAVDHPVWLINFVGLQQSVIDSIAVCEYKRGEGLVEGTECSVCLGEFEDGEDLRLLPKCSHAFHLPCIDTWLRSHKNCPLCRAPVVSAAEPARVGSLEETRFEGSVNQQVGEGEGGAGSGIGGIGDVGFGSVVPIAGQIGKICDSRAHSDLGRNWKVGFEGEVQAMRRSVSMDASSASMIYNAVANLSSDGAELRELKSSSFKNPCKHVGTGTSSSSGNSNLCRLMKSASLGRVVQKGPVSMKRSCSSRMRTIQDLIVEHESSSSLQRCEQSKYTV